MKGTVILPLLAPLGMGLTTLGDIRRYGPGFGPGSFPPRRPAGEDAETVNDRT